MNFFSLEFCHELQAAGCVSLSGEWWSCDNDGRFAYSHCRDCIPAFNSYCFTAPNEVAKDNCKKIWPMDKNENELKNAFGQMVQTSHEFHRYELIDLNSETEAEEYLKRNRGE